MTNSLSKYRLKKLVASVLVCIGMYDGQTQNQVDTMDVYRPKIAEFAIEFLTDYKAISSSKTFGNANSLVKNDQLIRTKLGIPLILKDRKMVGVQLKYYQHLFDFDTNNPTEYDLYSHLHGENFTSTGLRFFWQQNTKNSNEFRFIGGAEISSDQVQWNKYTSKYFVSGIYTWQLSPSTKMGTGFALTKGMQLTTFYPLFVYQTQLSPKWVLDLALPKSIAARWKVSNTSYIIAKTEFKGWRYNLTNAIVDANRNLTLRKADLLFSLAWEREIHDWLWFGLDVGYTKNLRYYLANPGDRGRDSLLDVKPINAGYFKISAFIVPPRRFYK